MKSREKILLNNQSQKIKLKEGREKGKQRLALHAVPTQRLGKEGKRKKKIEKVRKQKDKDGKKSPKEKKEKKYGLALHSCMQSEPQRVHDGL